MEKARVEIEYCTGCRWMLRAAWMAQELLTTFEADLAEVALKPGSGGVFEIRVENQTVWSRAGEGGFPEMKELKQRVRDIIAPGRSLGHSDSRSNRQPAGN
jgi:selenoprotein W-related protein